MRIQTLAVGLLAMQLTATPYVPQTPVEHPQPDFNVYEVHTSAGTIRSGRLDNGECFMELNTPLRSEPVRVTNHMHYDTAERHEAAFVIEQQLRYTTNSSCGIKEEFIAPSGNYD